MHDKIEVNGNVGEMVKKLAVLLILMFGMVISHIGPAFADKIEIVKSPTLNQEDVKDYLDVWLAEKKFPIYAEKKQHKLIGIYQKELEAAVYFIWSYVDSSNGEKHFEKGKIDLIRLNTGEWFDPHGYTLLFKRIKEKKENKEKKE